VQGLCDALGISDAILPAVALLWSRHGAGSPGRNDCEPETLGEFGDPNDSDNLVLVHELPHPKIFTPGDGAASWVQATQYETPEDGEDANICLAS
jgi:hypothetical protein